jgi:hypothetical protein
VRFGAAACLLLSGLLLVSALAVVPASQASEGNAPEEIQPGPYSGGGFPSTPIDFGVSADRHKVKRFTTRFKLDCKHGGRWVGELIVKKLVFLSPISIVKTARGGRFTHTSVVHYQGGGKLRTTVRGSLLAPDRAKGVLTAHARLPGDISCKLFFGPIRWTARYVGAHG